MNKADGSPEILETPKTLEGPEPLESRKTSKPPEDGENSEDAESPAEPELPQDTDSPGKPAAPEEPDNEEAPDGPEELEEPGVPENSETTDALQAATDPETTETPAAADDLETAEGPEADDPGPQEPQPASRTPKSRGISRRRALTALGIGAGALLAEQALVADGIPPAGSSTSAFPSAPPQPRGYAPDGAAGHAAALPLNAVKLLDSPFRQNQARNTAYLLFLDPERMLRSFRLNYGETSDAEPLGGWEKPDSQIRGHMTGHLLSGLALTYANTNDDAARSRGRYLVSQLAALQARAQEAGFHAGYLSGFPEHYFDILEHGDSVWSPYYMIHKYLAGMIDQYQLAGDDQALDVAVKLADWVDWRTSTRRLSYDQMQMVLNTEFGGLPESLANLYTITGRERYLATAQRFYHAAVLDPLADGMDILPGLQANVTTPKIIACMRMWEETGSGKYRDIAQNFWDIVTGHHVYVIGGVGNYEHFQQPDTVAAELSNFTCENCVSYNMLKLTRLLHFHQPQRVDMLDYYERTLLNQMLGEQDPGSPHGFNCYYTGLSTGAFKRQPLNYFPHGNPDTYATDWDTFTCDTATGLETQAKFADTIYSRDADGVYVNLLVPSEVTLGNLVLRQDTGFPDDPVVRLSVLSGAATMTLRVRVAKWVAKPPVVRLNGAPVTGLSGAWPSGWIALRRRWRAGDWLEVTMAMQLAVEPTPDHPEVQALTYGPVVLSAVHPRNPGWLTPQLDMGSISQTAAPQLAFDAVANRQPVKLLPIARAAHEFYTTYFQMA